MLIFEDRPHRGTHPLEYGHYEHTYRNGKLHNISDRIIWAYAIVKGAEAITTEDETKWSDLMNFQVFRDFRDIGMATENRREISELTDRGMSVRV